MRGTAVAIVMRLRAEAREQWRAWLLLAALVGVLAGAAIATAAGARRTGSVIERAQRVEQPQDIFSVPAYSENGELLDFDAISAFPEVVESFRVPLPAGAVDGRPRSMVVAPDQMFLGRQNVVAGRQPRRVGEAAVNFIGRDEWGWRVGTRVTVTFAPAGDDLEAPPAADGPRFTFEITAVLANVGDLGGNAEATMLLTPAFWRAHGNGIGSTELDTYRLRRGGADLEAFHDHVAKLTGGKPVFYAGSEAVVAQVRRSFQLLTAGLWILAGFLAVAAVLILTQLLLRASATESSDHPALRALGLTPRNLFALTMARLALVVVAGALISIAVAFGASAVFPLGRPRLVEPNPGALFDAVAIGGGALLAIVVPLVVCAVPIWRASRRVGVTDIAGRPGRAAGALARVLPRRPAIGAHLALGPPSGGSRAAIRPSVAATTLGLATLVATLVLSSSLQHLLATPRLYGWNWDVIVISGGDEPLDTDRLAELRSIGSFSAGITGDGLAVILRGQAVAMTAMDPRGTVTPPLLDGRLPVAADEVALGSRTLRHAGLDIGDRLTTRLAGGVVDASYRVVGAVVLPFTNDQTSMGEGAYATLAGARRLEPRIRSDAAFIRFRPGVPRAAAVAALRRAFPEAEVRHTEQPLTLLDLGRVKRFPFAVAVTVALLAAATVTHVLVTAVRGRRRDLAILRSLGLRRGDVRAAVAWQATILVTLALVIGLPVGLAVGRILWNVCAEGYGFVFQPIVPVVELAFVVGFAVVLANLIAALPGRAAARMSAATVLRTE